MSKTSILYWFCLMHHDGINCGYYSLLLKLCRRSVRLKLDLGGYTDAFKTEFYQELFQKYHKKPRKRKRVV